MSSILGGFLRTSRFWIPACTLPLCSYNYDQLYRTRLDEPTNDQDSEPVIQARTKAAQKTEILRAAKAFTKFADNGPSGKADGQVFGLAKADARCKSITLLIALDNH